MKKQHLFILGGLALVGYLWYRHEKSATDKASDSAKSITPAPAVTK